MTQYQGLFITVFFDSGPQVIFNTTIFSEEKALNLGVQGLTALQNGEDETLYGPLPTPRAELLGFVFTLKLAVRESSDERIRILGRPVNMWIIVRKPHIKTIFKNWDRMQIRLRNIINTTSFRSDDDLTTAKITNIEKQVRDVFESLPSDEFQYPHQTIQSINPKSRKIEYLPDDVKFGEMLLDHANEMFYLFVDEKQVANMITTQGSLDEMLYTVQEHVKSHCGKWYAIRLITDARRQEMIKRKYLQALASEHGDD